eukprot:TRINITY_DN10115_c0_g1_i1.p1 TRINITY_DN10115_c0_g1~~TRINITY_DN10115_c0_g1_i1.p1  ORF type:complete len:209 (+),score=49.99 TRINITY_DN10115_c0_g1_i1:42-668(+)
MTKYWSDEAYSQFYSSSQAERVLMNKAGPKTDRPQKQTDENYGGLWKPSRQELEKFQASFIEWSQGKNHLKGRDFRPMLRQVGVHLSEAQAAYFWKEVASEKDPPSLEFEKVLLAYRKIRDSPMSFNAAPGSAPPGQMLEDSLADPKLEVQEQFKPDLGLGPGLPLSEAVELLLDEGFPQKEVEILLKRHAPQGAIPQGVLFDLLSER